VPQRVAAVDAGSARVARKDGQSVVQALLAMLVTNAILTSIFFFGA